MLRPFMWSVERGRMAEDDQDLREIREMVETVKVSVGLPPAVPFVLPRERSLLFVPCELGIVIERRLRKVRRRSARLAGILAQIMARCSSAMEAMKALVAYQLASARRCDMSR